MLIAAGDPSRTAEVCVPATTFGTMRIFALDPPPQPSTTRPTASTLATDRTHWNSLIESPLTGQGSAVKGIGGGAMRLSRVLVRTGRRAGRPGAGGLVERPARERGLQHQDA